MNCFFCKKEVVVTDKIGRQDRCLHCGDDLHICRNCDFYDPRSYNECRESQAERVLDKEASNFCDYFKPTSQASSGINPADEAKRKLAELFKKK